MTKPLIMSNTLTRLSIPTSEGQYFFHPEEIIRLEANSNYTGIFFSNRKKLVTARVLKDFEKMLAPYGFVRTHRSHLINRQYIHFINTTGTIVMQDASIAEISRRKRKQVIKVLQHNPTVFAA